MKPLLALAATSVLLGACALPPAPATAAAGKSAAAAAPEDKGDEITGSRIRRKDAGVSTVSRDDFESARQSAGNVPPKGN